jgi:hypothetical protein
MKYIALLFFLLIIIVSCKHETTREHFYDTGELRSKCIYPYRKDTLNYQQLDYYPTGELLRKTTFKNGKVEGEYKKYYLKGNVLEHGIFHNGKQEGIFQQFDTTGAPATESYYLNGTCILYSDFLVSKDKRFNKQLFHGVTKDTAFPIGALVKSGDTIQKDLSFYAVITGKDSTNTIDYCFKLQIYARKAPNPKYEITFGKPNIHLTFDKIDTSFISTENEIQICNFKLAPGLNHIFGRIFVYNADSASFFVYKDIFVLTQK